MWDCKSRPAAEGRHSHFPGGTNSDLRGRKLSIGANLSPSASSYLYIPDSLSGSRVSKPTCGTDSKAPCRRCKSRPPSYTIRRSRAIHRSIPCSPMPRSLSSPTTGALYGCENLPFRPSAGLYKRRNSATQEGLLRGILYQVHNCHPELIDSVLPNSWQEALYAKNQDTVASHPNMAMLSQTRPADTAAIVTSLVDKASGVFLWVVLACRSIVEGMDAFDTIYGLTARVDELPKELEDLFQHILGRIESRWRGEAAKLLRLVFTNQAPAGLDPIPTFGLYLVHEQGFKLNADSHRGFDSPLEEFKFKFASCQTMEGRLRSRCGGLLEVQLADHSHSDKEFCACLGTSPSHDPYIDSFVIFMHRSVFEFLSQPSTWDLNVLQIEDQSFNSHVCYPRCGLNWPQRLLPGPASCTSHSTMR